MGLVLNGAIEEMNDLIPMEGIGERDGGEVLTAVQGVIAGLINQILEEANLKGKEADLESLNDFAYFLEVYIERLAEENPSLACDLLKLATLNLMGTKVKFDWPAGKINFKKFYTPINLMNEGYALEMADCEYDVISSASLSCDICIGEICLGSYYMGYISFVSDEIDTNVMCMYLPSELDRQSVLCEVNDELFTGAALFKPFIKDKVRGDLNVSYFFVIQKVPVGDSLVALNLGNWIVDVRVKGGFIDSGHPKTTARLLMEIEDIWSGIETREE